MPLTPALRKQQAALCVFQDSQGYIITDRFQMNEWMKIVTLEYQKIKLYICIIAA